MTKEQIATWLGRPLTPSEDTNFDSYLKNAFEKAEELLCFSLAVKAIQRSSTDVMECLRCLQAYSLLFMK